MPSRAKPRPTRSKAGGAAKAPKAPRAKKPQKVTGTRAQVRSAAARAVERVLSSKEAFALMMRRLESAGFRIERAPGEHPAEVERGEA